MHEQQDPATTRSASDDSRHGAGRDDEGEGKGSEAESLVPEQIRQLPRLCTREVQECGSDLHQHC